MVIYVDPRILCMNPHAYKRESTWLYTWIRSVIKMDLHVIYIDMQGHIYMDLHGYIHGSAVLYTWMYMAIHMNFHGYIQGSAVIYAFIHMVLDMDPRAIYMYPQCYTCMDLHGYIHGSEGYKDRPTEL